MIKLINPKETYLLRRIVLRNNLGAIKVPFLGDELENSFHFGYFFNDRLIGVLSAIYVSENKYQLRGMAILEEFQKKSIGTLLLKFVENHLKNKKITDIILNARESAINFYLKNHYEICSSAFEIVGIGQHYCMKKKLY